MFRENFVCCPRSLEKCRLWKTFFSQKCSRGHVQCSSNKLPKKIDKRPKTSAQCLKMIKKLHLFSKSFFEQIFYRYGECSFERPAKLFPLKYRKWSENSPQKMQKFFRTFFLKMFLWRGRKQLESPADFFFSTASRTFSARFSKINTL